MQRQLQVSLVKIVVLSKHCLKYLSCLTWLATVVGLLEFVTGLLTFATLLLTFAQPIEDEGSVLQNLFEDRYYLCNPLMC